MNPVPPLPAARAWLDVVEVWMAHYWKCLDDSPFAGPFATFSGDVGDLWLDWAKGLVPPIPPPSTTVDPKQKPATVAVSVTAPAGGVMRLRPSAFVDGAIHAVPDSLVTLTPAVIAGGQTRSVKVSVLPPLGVPGGTYGGFIVDAAANVVVPHVQVVIVPA